MWTYPQIAPPPTLGSEGDSCQNTCKWMRGSAISSRSDLQAIFDPKLYSTSLLNDFILRSLLLSGVTEQRATGISRLRGLVAILLDSTLVVFLFDLADQPRGRVLLLQRDRVPLVGRDLIRTDLASWIVGCSSGGAVHSDARATRRAPAAARWSSAWLCSAVLDLSNQPRHWAARASSWSAVANVTGPASVATMGHSGNCWFASSGDGICGFGSQIGTQIADLRDVSPLGRVYLIELNSNLVGRDARTPQSAAVRRGQSNNVGRMRAAGGANLRSAPPGNRALRCAEVHFERIGASQGRWAGG